MSEETLTTSAGIPVTDDQNSITTGERGPILLQDSHLIEKLAHFNRERIPERVVHAKGSGAYGIFTLNTDLSKYTIADFLSGSGKQTEVFVRFSTVGGESGSADAERDPRGFAVKFYTTQGNHDVVGNNTPVFFIRDPIKFPDFVHSQKRDPQTNLKSPEMVWDFWSLNPAAMHQITILFSDRGVPASYRHMNGYGSHSYSLWNADGERFWIKWHFKTAQGIKCLTESESRILCGQNPDHAQADLVNSIEQGDFPSWNVKLQIMPEQQVDSLNINPFDLTKVWPHNEFPLMEIGTLELNRNVDDYFAETEQSAFSPSNLVPGTGASPDKVLQARLFAYPDAQRYRVGPNYNNLAVNCPHASRVRNYQRAGSMAGATCPSNSNGEIKQSQQIINYGPNSQNGPLESGLSQEPPLRIRGDACRYDTRTNIDDYSQAGDLYWILPADEQQRLIENIAGSLGQASFNVRATMLVHFDQCDAEYGLRLRKALGD